METPKIFNAYFPGIIILCLINMHLVS